jgi:hypothetical protein
MSIFFLSIICTSCRNEKEIKKTVGLREIVLIRPCILVALIMMLDP